MKRKGFSVFEAVVILAFLAFLISLTSTSFHNLAPKYRLKKAVWEISSQLNCARFKAILEGRAVRVKFSSTGYVLEKYDESQKGWRPEVRNLLEGVLVEANNSPTFFPMGTVSNLASIIISNSWGKYKITLAISGRVKVMTL